MRFEKLSPGGSQTSMIRAPSIADFTGALDRADRFEASRYMAKHSHAHVRFLYKFSPARPISLVGTIVRSQLWMAPRSDFNDPMEMQIDLRFEGTPSQKLAYFRAAAKRTGIPPALRAEAARRAYAVGRFEERANDTFNQHVSEYGICCFSKTVRSAQMWAYYANSSRGVCYQFHVARSPNPLVLALPIEYSDEPVSINWLKSREVDEHLGRIFFKKTKNWEHEAEHRIVEKGWARAVLPFLPGALVGIVIGCEARRMTILRVLALCIRRKRLGLPHVTLYRAVPNRKTLKLEIRRAIDLDAIVADR